MPDIEGRDPWHYEARCRGHADVFFPENYNETTIMKARAYCRICPVYEQCRAEATEHYEDHDDGIMFGYGPVERRQMLSGRFEYRDWRNDTRMVSKRTLAALERHAARRGVRAVLDMRRIYEVDDVEERKLILRNYEEWLADQHYPVTPGEVVLRAQHFEALARNERDAPPRAKALPVELRPECPNGHDKKHMARIGRSRRANGDTVWTCYLCKAKVVAEPADLIPEHLRVAG